ncbi:hypothetical protein [Agromyces intestinalis]|uniref:hypothetical protein n=1 Tax=Agromyces intestinalis TaxID=2592652 RepID=UPI00143D1A79|nr:hypothetical protein [Agromyces intestinalis]
MSEHSGNDHHIVSHDRYDKLKEAYNRRARARVSRRDDFDAGRSAGGVRIRRDDDSD